jgi:hypothetical protein
LDLIDAEPKKKSNAAEDAILEKVTEIDSRCAVFEQSFEAHQSAISWQLECTRRLQHISDAAGELRTSAATAKFLSDDESENEGIVRSSAVRLLGSVQQELESFVLPSFEGKHLSVLSMQIEKIQKMVREATLANPTLSIEQIECEARNLLQELDCIHEWAKTIEDEEMYKRVSEIKESWNET